MPRRPRGAGTVYREGPAWSFRLGTGPDRRYETGFRTKQEAEDRIAFLRSEKVQQRLGPATDPRLALTLHEFATPWLKTRESSHATGKEDGYRWENHLRPYFGHLRPEEVDTARIRAFALAKGPELAPGSIRICISILSQLFEDLIERHLVRANPARGLPQSVLRLMPPDHDPETTPFIHKLEDVKRVFLALEEPFNVAFAIGAFAGLRTGEVFQLRWPSLDLKRQRILVAEGGSKNRTKDKEARTVPILDALLPVLEAWRLAHKGNGRVIPPLRVDGEKISKGTPGPILRAALRGLGLHDVAEYDDAWYAATRHTFASQWAMSGRPLRELQKILGHSSIAQTERYAHLAPDYFAPGVHQALAVDLRPAGEVAALPPPARRGAPAAPAPRAASGRRAAAGAPGAPEGQRKVRNRLPSGAK